MIALAALDAAFTFPKAIGIVWGAFAIVLLAVHKLSATITNPVFHGAHDRFLWITTGDG